MTSDIELIEYGTPFSYDQRNKELFVTHNDFSFVVKEDMDNLCYYVYTWIKEDKAITKGKVVDFLDDCKSKRRYLTDYKLEKYTLICTIKKEANTGLNTVNLNIFTKDLAKWLAENMYLACCAKCGEESDIYLDHIDGKTLVICDDCKHGRAKVFVDPTTPAPKEAAKPQKPEVDIFDLSDLMPQSDDEDDISDFADEAVLPVSEKENEMPDMDRFESVSFDDEPPVETAKTVVPNVETPKPAEKSEPNIDDIFEELLPKTTPAPKPVAKPAEPSFDEILTAKAPEPVKSAPKPVAKPAEPTFDDILTAKAPEPVKPAPKPVAKPAEPTFDEMLTAKAPEPAKPAPKPVAKPAEPTFDEILTAKAPEPAKPVPKPVAKPAEPTFDEILTAKEPEPAKPVPKPVAKPAEPTFEEIVTAKAPEPAKPAPQAAAPKIKLVDMSAPTEEPVKLAESAPAMTLPQGYTPDNPTDEKGEYYHPLMTKKKSENETDNGTITEKTDDISFDGAASHESKDEIKVEAMESGDELHDAFKHLAGNSKNIDVMIDREIGYKSKSDNEINKLTQASGKNKEFLQSKGEIASSNVFLGILGSLGFGLIAVACWVFVGFMLYNDLTLDSLGYIMGIFLAFAVVSGYQKVGRYLDAKGIIISFIMAVVLTLVSVTSFSCLVIYDKIRCYDDAFKNEAQAVCEYAMLDEASRTPEKLETYLGKDWGDIEIIDGFKYALFYDDGYDYLKTDELMTKWFPKDGYTIMGRYYQDLILSFVVVAITFVLAVANAQNWKKSSKS